MTQAHDVGHVRFRVPDIERSRQFLTAFGMVEAEDTGTRLCMRGHDADPVIYACEQGEAGFAGFSFVMRSIGDLEVLAEREGVDIAPLDLPGGGSVVRLRDPDGFAVEAVAGQSPADTLGVPERLPWNHAGTYPRQSRPRRIPARPSHVRRLGHVVLNVSDFRHSEAWYKDRFGLLTSDEIRPAPVPESAIGAFLRCDRGDRACDHHTLFLMQTPMPPAFMHAAFEVIDIDDLMAGHDHLAAAGYDHQWGVGRHFLGSQIFDYWRDPFGNELEHWTDGDQLSAADPPGIASMEELVGVQWGMAMPPLPPEMMGGRAR